MTLVTQERANGMRQSEKLMVLLAFAAIYIIWGSTYLAIRYAVETIPPLLVAGTRHFVAGVVLFAWAWFRGYRPTRREWRSAVVLGFLFFLVSHGALHWAEQTVPSGIAALLIASEPMMVAVLAVMLGRERMTWRSGGGIALGLVGVALLTTDHTVSSQATSLVGVAAIIIGTISWCYGMLYSQSAELPTDAVAKSALPLLTGSAMLYVAATLMGEFSQLHFHQVAARSLVGLAYLSVFGTIVAFTAYTWLLERISASLVASHAYVNPVVAVVLGWLVGGETITTRIILSALLVLVSVLTMTTGASKERSPLEEEAAERVA